MLKFIDLRIVFINAVIMSVALLFLAIILILICLNACYSSFVKVLGIAEDLIDRFFKHPFAHSFFKHKTVQVFSVFLVLSVMVFSFLVKTSDALVVEAQGRYISEQKFIAQVEQDTPDAIFFSKKERLNE